MKRTIYFFLVLFISFSTALNACNTNTADETTSSRSVSETVITHLDPSWTNESASVSLDHWHIAFNVSKDPDKPWATVTLVIEGREVTSNSGGAIFSPDGNRIAYSTFSNEGERVIVDGLEGKYYDHVANLTFSSDSKHYAYTANEGEKYFLVLDGEEIGRQYDRVGGFVFTFEGYQAAFIVKKNEKWLTLIDGIEGKPYDYINMLAFSPDGKRVAYAARESDKYFLVVDGTEGENRYESIGKIVFSPDSERIAYQVTTKAGFYWVVDGKEGKKYDSVSNLNFSPDGRRFAYYARSGSADADKAYVVVDGFEREIHGNIHDKPLNNNLPVFSPDSQRLAYPTWLNDNEEAMIIDGVESKTYESVGQSVFSFDGKRYAFIATVNGKQFVVVDGVPGKKYDSIYSDVVFDSNIQFHYAAQNDGVVYRVVEIIQ
jgi:hypothetical protein